MSNNDGETSSEESLREPNVNKNKAKNTPAAKKT